MAVHCTIQTNFNTAPIVENKALSLNCWKVLFKNSGTVPLRLGSFTLFPGESFEFGGEDGCHVSLSVDVNFIEELKKPKIKAVQRLEYLCFNKANCSCPTKCTSVGALAIVN